MAQEARLTVSQPPPPLRRRPQQLHLRGRMKTMLPNVDPRLMPAKVPNPSHRHGTPSGPWPFLDLHAKIDPNEILNPKTTWDPCPHPIPDDNEHCWCRYPQSLYPNWTPVQQKASRISEAFDNHHDWRVYPLVVSKDGIFLPSPKESGRYADPQVFWDTYRKHESEGNDGRVRALFIENMAGPIMQMLGTKYNIEPFFFSSSFGWIPSRYQESLIQGQSDHITITLPFIRCIEDPFNLETNNVTHDDTISSRSRDDEQSQRNIAIKTNEFLWLASSDKILFSDILSLHMIRHPTHGHTIISYHAHPRFRATTAAQLRDRFQLTGRSVYWSHIFATSNDPTFTFLSLLWYALYAWDESLESLYSHICVLESEVLEKNDLNFTQELHRIRAHLLHYTSLLADFRKTVNFIKDTPYPALENEKYFSKAEKEQSIKLMEKECDNLLHQIERLDMGRKMQDKRLTNVMQLGFSTINIQDSRRMHDLTRAAVRDSAAMKQIAYLTMFFLPASFVATAFGMNVQEINGSPATLGQYFAAALPLTALTIWIIVAFQIQINDTSTSRRRVRKITPNRRRGNADSSDGGSQGPYGLKKAYTVGGEIVVDQGDAENEQGTSSSRDYDKTQYDEDGGDYEEDSADGHNNKGAFRQATIWKRLGWPISLTQAAIVKWKEDRDRKRRPKRKPPQVRKMSEGRDQVLPLHSMRSDGAPLLSPAAQITADTGPPLSPAAQIAADTRSTHPAQNSVRSVAHSTQSSVPPPLPPKTPTPKSTWGVPEVGVTSYVQAVDPDIQSNDLVMTDTKDNEQDLQESRFESGSLRAEVPFTPGSTA